MHAFSYRYLIYVNFYTSSYNLNILVTMCYVIAYLKTHTVLFERKNINLQVCIDEIVLSSLHLRTSITYYIIYTGQSYSHPPSMHTAAHYLANAYGTPGAIFILKTFTGISFRGQVENSLDLFCSHDSTVIKIRL